MEQCIIEVGLVKMKRCNKCGLPKDLCVCDEIEREEQRRELNRNTKEH